MFLAAARSPILQAHFSTRPGLNPADGPRGTQRENEFTRRLLVRETQSRTCIDQRARPTPFGIPRVQLLRPKYPSAARLDLVHPRRIREKSSLI